MLFVGATLSIFTNCIATREALPTASVPKNLTVVVPAELTLNGPL